MAGGLAVEPWGWRSRFGAAATSAETGAGRSASRRSRLALIGLAIAVFACGRKIRLEEANLNQAFGADCHAYRRSTWALVPGLF